MLAPAVPDVMKSLHSDNSELKSFVVSIYVIGSAVGPLVAAPISEVYGRSIVYNVSNVIFLGATVGCALSSNVGMFLAFRLICGCSGAAPLALGGGSISDLMELEQWGTAMAIWGFGSLVPPVRLSWIHRRRRGSYFQVVAPIAGGYLSQDAGWRWIFWVIAIPVCILYSYSCSFTFTHTEKLDAGLDGYPDGHIPFRNPRNLCSSPLGAQSKTSTQGNGQSSS